MGYPSLGSLENTGTCCSRTAGSCCHLSKKDLLGASQGMNISFSFVFPDDYIQVELRGKEVEVHAKIHKVFNCVGIITLQDLKYTWFRNRYDFPDLELLRDQNEILYYLALRDADPHVLLRTPSHFLTLVHRLAKLGKPEDIRRLAKMLQGKPTALNAFAETLVGCGKYASGPRILPRLCLWICLRACSKECAAF